MKMRTDSTTRVEINYVVGIQGMFKQLIDKVASAVTSGVDGRYGPAEISPDTIQNQL